MFKKKKKNSFIVLLNLALLELPQSIFLLGSHSVTVLWPLLDGAQRQASPPKGIFSVCYQETLAQKGWIRYTQICLHERFPGSLFFSL